MKSQATKKKLLSEDRTFEQALKVAQADELAEKGCAFCTKEIKSSTPSKQTTCSDYLLLPGKLLRNFVFVVDPHNIWLISAATVHLFVIFVRRRVI